MARVAPAPRMELPLTSKNLQRQSSSQPYASCTPHTHLHVALHLLPQSRRYSATS